MNFFVEKIDWLQDTLTALKFTIPCVLDKPEVLAGITERPRLLPWEFDTLAKYS